MQPARIAELLEPFVGPSDARRLTPDILEHISTYIDILQRWNARVNLTSIRNEEEIVTRHFGESLFAARHLFTGGSHVEAAAPGCPVEPSSTGAYVVADLGSGAGFPGIPIKLWAPQIHLTLIESNQKKATFLREVTRALTLMDINILSVRAETLAPGTYSLVTLRAVERFEMILPIASRLVVSGGRLALLIGTRQLQTAKNSHAGVTWLDPLTIPGSSSRVLLIGSRTP